MVALIVKTTVCRQNGARGPLRVLSAQESNQGGDILNLAHTRGSRGSLDHRLHIFQELLVTLKPLI